MAKIIVTTDQTGQGAPPVLLEESVYPVHLSTEHAARQLIERLTWALHDAEAAEPERVRNDRRASEQPRRAPLRPRRGSPRRTSTGAPRPGAT